MKKGTRYVGLDVHAESIAAPVAEPDGEVRRLGTIPEQRRRRAQVDEEARSGAELEGLLRGWALWIRVVLAADEVGRSLRRRCADAGAGQGGRPREDGPARRRQARPQLSQRRLDGCLGAGRGA